MQCFYKKFPQKWQFVFQHETGDEHPNAAPKGKIDGSPNSPEDKAQKMLAGALNTCDAFSCKIEKAEKPWQKEADRILEKIQKDTGLGLAFNSFLKEYVHASSEQVAFETREDVSQNFYEALSVVGVPDSVIGFNTAWNDILHFAEQGVSTSEAKWPYERLKSVIDSVRNSGEPIEISQK